MKSTETNIKRIPIKRSIASSALTPRARPSFSEDIKIIPAISQATNKAKIHSGHLPGSWAIIRITAAIADGPAINGTASHG